jgi:hypothetical protein
MIGRNSFFLFFAVLGLELRAFYLEPFHQPNFFVIGFFEIGFHELFAWADFEP